MIERITEIDFSVLDFIQAHFKCAFLDAVMPFLSMLGEFGIVWLSAIVVMLFFKKTRRCAILMFISIAVVFATQELLLKNLFMRVRPCNVRDAVDMIVSRPSSYSFPSGHASSGFTVATTVFLHFRKWGIAALALAALISFSRLYNYVHYPTDILVGAAYGILMAILIYYIAKKVKPAHKLGKSER